MVIEQQAAPYAPADNVLSVIRRFRDRGLPDQLTPNTVRQVGVPEGNAHRTIAALRFLGLIDEDGRRTETFNRLRQATTEQYPEQLAQVIQAAYAPVFTIVDPATDNEIQLHDAFRQYEPQAQRDKMIALFRGLCREAGLIEGGPQRRSRTPLQPARQPMQRRQVPPQDTNDKHEQQQHDYEGYTPDYRPLSSLMQQLPKGGTWTQAHRDRWMRAFAANVDLLIEIVPEGGDA